MTAGPSLGLPHGFPHGLPHDASLDGHRVDWIFGYLSVATGICFVVMAAVLIVAAIFHREGRRRAEPRYTHGNGRAAAWLTLFTGATVFFGIDAVALRRSASDLRQHFWKFPDGDPAALRVEVTAQQWAWTFRYAGADGRFDTADDVITLNELHVPVATPIYLKLRSKDVVHSLYLPNFRTKIDAVPGSTTRLWFEAREVGQFEIGCAQHCGVSHYKMRGVLTSSQAADFQRWLARATADAAQRRGTGDGSDAGGWDWES
jgi:cytochrome c oxidase subunit 2